MTTGWISDLVDAIGDDLGTLDLPAHSTWLYVDPPALRPDLGTMLGIFPRLTDYEVLATDDSYSEDDTIVIAWYVPMLAGLENGGVGNPDVAKAALADAEAIIARLRSYATAVPGFADQSEATLTTVRFGTIVGASTWVAEISLKVTRWPANDPST